VAGGLDIEKIANEGLKKFGLALDKRLKSRLKSHIVSELKSTLLEAGIDFKRVMEEQFDILIAVEESGSGPVTKSEDPTSLSRFRPIFSNQVERDVKNIKFEGDSVIINIGNLEEWGLSGNREDSDQPLYFLSYYIEGAVGEFGFLPIDLYLKGQGKFDGTGKHGYGFLISKENYVGEKWEERTGVPFSEVKHAISGQPPFNGFNIAAENFDWSPYISKAVQIAFEKTFQEKIS
jgi:hypothetical protein